MPKKKKRKKVKTRKKRLKKNISKKAENTELIYKTKGDWIKKAIVNKSRYEKNIPSH